MKTTELSADKFLRDWAAGGGARGAAAQLVLMQIEDYLMKTGRFRVRRNILGQAVLQQEYDFPSFLGGQVDASVRQLSWVDVKFDKLDSIRFAKMKLGDEKY